MKLLCLILLAAIASSSDAALRVQPNAVHPNHPGKCYAAGLTLDVGEMKNFERKCESVECSDNFTITYETCGTVTVESEESKVTAINYEFDYPKCCPHVVCG